MSLIVERFPRTAAAINLAVRTVRLYAKARSLRALARMASTVTRRALGKRIPIYATVALTFRCQCRCVHCYAEGRQDTGRVELTTAQFRDVLRQLADLGVIRVAFSGGEPMLRSDLAELVAFATELGMLTRISTNGFLVNRERLAELRGAGLTQCGISIDSADPDVHDRLRGLPGAFDRAIEGLRLVREFGIEPEILTYASRANVTDGLEAILALGRRLGVSSAFLFFPVASGKWESALGEVLSDDERARVRALQDLSHVHVEMPTDDARCCVFQHSVLYISPYGDVMPCPFTPYAAGNVLRAPLADIWRALCHCVQSDVQGKCTLNDPETRTILREEVAAAAARTSSAP
jgi:MoaA/NifB/PqqE/SkfB family radical SAM enzyme